MKKKYYCLEITYTENIDLSNETIKEFFEFPKDYEVTEDDRNEYFEEYFIPSFLKEHNLEITDIFDYKYSSYNLS